MANERWPVLTPAGSEVLPVADGTYYTPGGMGASTAANCQVYVEFFSDAAGLVPVTPGAGTVDVRGSPMGNNWVTPSAGGIINAIDAGSPLSTYVPPSFVGRMEKGRAQFSGITGAVSARVTFWRF
jgi:hypothetical protein